MITGDCSYREYKMSQHANAIQVFSKLIEKIKPSRILEIGTYTGGFIVAIKDIVTNLELPTIIDTYDVIEREPYTKIRSLGINLYVENIFNSEYTDLSESQRDSIVSYIQGPGTTLVLCDGGNKINEFNSLSKYIKSGDFIMAHDYSASKEYFQSHINGKIWNWCEITENDISQACLDNNLKDYMRSEFQPVVWVCKQKV